MSTDSARITGNPEVIQKDGKRDFPEKCRAQGAKVRFDSDCYGTLCEM